MSCPPGFISFFGSIMFVLLYHMTYSQPYDAELLVQKTEIEIVNRTLTKTTTCQIKINNRSGEKYATIVIPYSKLERVSNIEGYVIDASGSKVNSLNKSEITERSSIADFSLFEDHYVKEFTLKHNAYPYTIVYSFQSQQNEFLYVDYWNPVLNSSVPTHKASLTVQVPMDYAIAHKTNYINSPSLVSSASHLLYSWTTQYAASVRSEVLSPPLTDFLPTVIIVPVDFRYDLPGSFTSWTAYGDWQMALLKGLQELPESEKNRILERTGNIVDIKEKVKALYHDLQDKTRYVNISIETGGMKPFPASVVSVNQYGDCKALTNYFKAQLDFLGVTSYYTKVHAARLIQPIDTTFPSQQFNHVILYVPLDQDTLWLDCTSDGPFNYLGTFTQNRQVLVVDDNRTHFLKTPALLPDDVVESRNYTISNTGTSSIVNVNAICKGKMFEVLNELEMSHSADEQLRYINNFVVEPTHALQHFALHREDRDSRSIRLSYQTVAQDIYAFYGNDILVRNIPYPLPAFESPEMRKLPLQFDYPVNRIDTLTYAMPVGYTLQTLGTDQEIHSSFGKYSLMFIEKDSTIFVIKRFVLHAGNYPLSDYPAFYSFIRDVKAAENKTYITLSK